METGNIRRQNQNLWRAARIRQSPGQGIGKKMIQFPVGKIRLGAAGPDIGFFCLLFHWLNLPLYLLN
jgi:hypothetical protein